MRWWFWESLLIDRLYYWIRSAQREVLAGAVLYCEGVVGVMLVICHSSGSGNASPNIVAEDTIYQYSTFTPLTVVHP